MRIRIRWIKTEKVKISYQRGRAKKKEEEGVEVAQPNLSGILMDGRDVTWIGQVVTRTMAAQAAAIIREKRKRWDTRTPISFLVPANKLLLSYISRLMPPLEYCFYSFFCNRRYFARPPNRENLVWINSLLWHLGFRPTWTFVTDGTQFCNSKSGKCKKKTSKHIWVPYL